MLLACSVDQRSPVVTPPLDMPGTAGNGEQMPGAGSAPLPSPESPAPAATPATSGAAVPAPAGSSMNAAAGSAAVPPAASAGQPNPAPASGGSGGSAASGMSDTMPEPPLAPGDLATLLWAVGGEGIGPGLFGDARFVAAEGSGAIYVAENSQDDGPGRVQRFNADGSFASQWFVVDTANITGLVADRNGILYVNQGGAITRYTGATGMSLGYITLPDYSDSPLAIALTPDNGLLTVARTQMLRLNSSLQVVLDVDTIRPVLDDSIFIHGAAMDGTGNIFVVASFENAVFEFDNAGNFRDRVGTEGAGVGHFDSDPEAVAVDGRGRIYAVDDDGIEVFDPDGNSRGIIAASPSIFGMTITDENELIVMERNEHTLIKYALTP